MPAKVLHPLLIERRIDPPCARTAPGRRSTRPSNRREGHSGLPADALLAACQATALPPGEAVQDAILGYQNACAAHVAASQAVRVSEGFR